MKTNLYTSKVNELHAPAAAVERALAYAREREDTPLTGFRRSLIAAAFVLLLIATAVISGIYIVPCATIYLDSRESVSITLDSRSRVLCAAGYPALSGQTADTAVVVIVEDMLDSGALTEEENTLILGTSMLSQEEQAQLVDTVQDVFTESRFHGAIVCLPCSGGGGKAAVIDLLLEQDDTLSRSYLYCLSANELNLLLHQYESDGVLLIGEPSPCNVTTQSVKADHAIETRAEELPSQHPSGVNGSPSADGSYDLPLISARTPQDPVTGEKATVAPAQNNTTATTEATEIPTVSRSLSTVQHPTVVSTEPPAEAVRMDSFGVNIPYDSCMRSVEPFALRFGEKISFTAIPNSYRWRMNWQPGSSALSKNAVTELGKEDSYVALYCTDDDFVHDTFAQIGYDTDFGEYLTRMRAENGIGQDFFRENALIVVTYFDCVAYQNENDSISVIQVDGDTAYIKLLRQYRSKGSRSSETDVYKCVVAAKVKKSDIRYIKQMKLIVTTQDLQ